MPSELTVEEQWYRMLTEGEPTLRTLRRVLRMLSSSPRCKMCNAPY
jgi:hypothetical protein